MKQVISIFFMRTVLVGCNALSQPVSLLKCPPIIEGMLMSRKNDLSKSVKTLDEKDGRMHQVNRRVAQCIEREVDFPAMTQSIHVPKLHIRPVLSFKSFLQGKYGSKSYLPVPYRYFGIGTQHPFFPRNFRNNKRKSSVMGCLVCDVGWGNCRACPADQFRKKHDQNLIHLVP
jgi:hypothetical protein